ncbi:hypothetical protein K431DRAFT_297353 [Polychaeton citri CBS 116435]|uniref:Zn(2)-C6 fungal-type domain-containing protein n=1 Tax=Polychaeton citri CBS 116435 TaxID=1314669 RepID=A0A9P4UKZ2_9PEZI|nr:hypothetical protein K431DRAFT_297353 [Polychaeton citri CBS 116435]
MSLPVAQLSCQQCQSRKTKCSRTVPCSACQKAGISCTAVQRHRLPRGRSGKQKPDVAGGQVLKDRISRLEAIVSQLQYGGSSEQALLVGTERDHQSSFTSTPTPVEAFIAPAFWTELSDAVAGLKDVLEHPETSEEADGTSTFDPGTASAANPHAIIFGSDLSILSDNLVPPPKLKVRLLSVYEDRVDAIFKLLHWPSTLSTVRPKSSSRQDTRLPVDARALESAIYFTATCSLFDHELDQRTRFLKHFQKTTEQTLSEAGLLATTSLVVLQAFVIYLAGLRACQANAQQWTLVATAIRIASAQGIPGHPSTAQSSLDEEIRRRLWFCIGVLDLQSAFDRGSQPLLKCGDFQRWPLDMNDADMSL